MNIHGVYRLYVADDVLLVVGRVRRRTLDFSAVSIFHQN